MIRLDKVLRTRFIINNEPVYTCDPKEILQNIFCSVPDIMYWSAEALRGFVTGSFVMINDFGEQVKKELKEVNSSVSGEVNARFTRFRAWTTKSSKFIPKDREKLIKFVYNTIMSCEGKGLLAGFGLSNKHKDTIPGNPEMVTICPLPVEIPKRRVEE